MHKITGFLADIWRRDAMRLVKQNLSTITYTGNCYTKIV